jgi:hypothetical protein
VATRAVEGPIEARAEEWAAARGVLVAVTAATGGMLAAFAFVGGGPPLALGPALLVAIGGRIGLPDAIRGAAGASIWLLVAPHAHAEALVAPLSMAAAWAAVAVGPERLAAWIRAEWTGREASPGSPPDGGSPEPIAWIEDDLSVR